jgi:DNA transformation protein
MPAGFDAYVQEVFAPFGRVAIKRLFGGKGIWLGEHMFALIGPGDTICLKTDEESRPAYLEEGSEEFVWVSSKAGMVWNSGYYTMPARLFDEPDELVLWAEAALRIAQQAKSTRPVKAARKKGPRSARPKSPLSPPKTP